VRRLPTVDEIERELISSLAALSRSAVR